jgi:hypothetical protein
MMGPLRSAWCRASWMWDECVLPESKSNVDQNLTVANRLLHGTPKNRVNSMSLWEALRAYEHWSEAPLNLGQRTYQECLKTGSKIPWQRTVRWCERGCVSIVTWWKEDGCLSIRKNKSTDDTHHLHGDRQTTA